MVKEKGIFVTVESPPNDSGFFLIHMYVTSFLTATFHDIYAQISVLCPKYD